jgi:type I restriction enzyme R subunit
VETTWVTLYQASLRTYKLLRYGVEVQIAAGKPHEQVHLVDWEHPERNDFAIAEEVTLKGGYERRPDLVIYLNGIAVAVIELKRGAVAVRMDGLMPVFWVGRAVRLWGWGVAEAFENHRAG